MFDVFPAYAGMSRRDQPFTLTLESFPRLRGDEPSTARFQHVDYKFSPPTRG